jgi:hypothetical protein
VWIDINPNSGLVVSNHCASCQYGKYWDSSSKESLSVYLGKHRYRYSRIKNVRELSNGISSNEEIYKVQNTRNFLTCFEKNWLNQFKEIMNQSQNFCISCMIYTVTTGWNLRVTVYEIHWRKLSIA